MKTVEYKPDNRWVVEVECASCAEKVFAWTSSGMSECYPHFFCECCSNVYLYQGGKSEILQTNPTPQLVGQLEAQLPGCPCGGSFKPGANPKCPHCGHAFEHQRDAVERLSDPHMIVMDRACVYSDKAEPYKVIIKSN